MLEQAEATFVAERRLDDIEVGMSWHFEGVSYAAHTPHSGTEVRVVARAPIAIEHLSFVEADPRNSAHLILNEGAGVGHGLQNLAQYLSFELGVGILCSMGARQVLAEGEDETAALEAWGTSRIWGGVRGHLSMRSFNFPELDAEARKELFRRSAGLRLFSDSLRNRQASAQFRDLWRLLEAAFHSKDSDLVRHLGEFEPAARMRFTERELKELLVLRGRVSHAESKAGLKEIAQADGAARAVLGRLQVLAEQVLLNKRTWGTPASHHAWRARVRSFPGPRS